MNIEDGLICEHNIYFLFESTFHICNIIPNLHLYLISFTYFCRIHLRSPGNRLCIYTQLLYQVLHIFVHILHLNHDHKCELEQKNIQHRIGIDI